MQMQGMTQGMTQNGARPAVRPFSRRVFYIPGYDPFPPRRYRELYRKEGAEQARISGHALRLTARGGAGAGWHVAAVVDGRPAEADIEVLVWSDIVRASMATGIAGTYAQLLRTAWIYTRSGALFRLVRLRKGPMIAALYPVVLLLAQLAAAGTLGWLAARLAGLPWALPLGAGVAWGVLQLCRRWDNRVFAHYLMHDYAFSAHARGADPPALQARLDRFRDSVRMALDGDHDEVLVVGHSSGAHLAVQVVAGLIRGGLPAQGPALGLLTLGQVVPMVSFLPEARGLRADLRLLAGSDALTWVDVTAPGDGCAFALCDPVAVSGVAPAGQRWPLVVSAAFTQTLAPARWRRLRWRFFRLHFQYLCAFDRPGHYDYFAITAGAQTLADRYRGRPASRHRITRPMSGHTSVG
jgi:hypothetical protein